MRILLMLGVLAACSSQKAPVVIHDTVYLPAPAADKPALAVNPCDRPRPYKNWTNAELNTAQVRYMGTPQSQGLMDEAACRLR